MEHILYTKQICKVYEEKKVLNDITLNIGKGEIYGLLGKNGAGKTTLMKILTSLVLPTSGEVFVLGESATHNNSILRNVGSVIEVPVFYYHLSAEENLRIFCKYKNLEENHIKKYLEIVGLYNERMQLVKKFSLGMKQRLGIARAMLGEPQILILDEPINGLDPEGICDIRKLLLFLSKELKTSILLSSHIIGEIENIADRVGFMSNGSLIMEKDKKMLEDIDTIYEVKVENSDAEVGKFEKDVNIVYKDDKLIRIQSQKKYIEIIEMLNQAGVKYIDVCIKRITLEDIFLEIV